MSEDTDLVEDMLRSLSQGHQIPLLTSRPGGLSMSEAYRLSAQITDARTRRGEKPVGRKIGFTNKTIWTDFNVSAPMCGTMYDSTVRPLDGSYQVAARLEPRIEPEIAFRLSAVPQPGMSPKELIACVSDVCAGFEMVQSFFANWAFQAADTVAAFGLHGALLHGPLHPVAAADRKEWVARLAEFRTTLHRNGEVVDEGHASNVLGGGPLVALGYLVDLITREPQIAPLLEGDIITTGTLTRALPVGPGETWHASFDGLPLDPIEVSLV
ncbi:2-keto-4-pentenoate hydratase [Seohaeicola saemankumensis]|uniref:2-keto-4-pentenoate hydratase n=1 Tax=Seohaeicola saemankumensis TaxID=481181 RepID=A0ABW3TEC3_9RHOB